MSVTAVALVTLVLALDLVLAVTPATAVAVM